MMKSRKVLILAIYQLPEVLLLYSIYAPFSDQFSWYELLLLILSYTLVISISGFLNCFFKLSLPLQYTVIISMTFVVSWLVTSSFLFSIPFSLFLAVRSRNKWMGELESNIEAVLALNLVVVVGYIFLMKQGLTLLLGIIGLQFALLVGMKIGIYFTIPKEDKNVWNEFKVPFIVILIGVCSFVMIEPLKRFYVHSIDGILLLLYYVLYIPVWFVFTYIFIPIINLFKKDYVPSKTIGEGDGTEVVLSEVSYRIPTAFYWVCIALLLLMILLLFLVYRKRVNKISSGTMVSLATIPEPRNIKSKQKKWLYSNDRTRMKFLKFEKKMEKMGYGRKIAESPSIWFRRLHLAGLNAEVVLAGYERVRYGEISLEKEEFDLYHMAIKELERTLLNKRD
ncbi:hypothetical protein [Fictibacillus sp. BK138]|uniref:hypothetical protein n=1 Tax=Fictibacillus sp. BK138 TaxID=2512121 RepID=UPI001029B535|nr:hypothetical protein [Fictibacillus sp. BK138]RZT15547.1 hypothetical protein EV282_3752 [Fictibacillus sp. BK138]